MQLSSPSIIAIGASTGGPVVFLNILRALPKRFPVPILAVQHVADGFITSFVEWLQPNCKIRIKIAQEGEKIQAGTVYFAPEDKHLHVTAKGIIRISTAPPIAGHRPSIDETFNSLQKNFSPHCWAFLLTGMGKDGAKGLKALREEGCYTAVQDPASSVIYGMPGEALRLNGAVEILHPTIMVERLLALAEKKPTF
ncbi:CheB methylesterase domain-containing protein [Heliorestis acidaminivorans]|uniref:CheB methylesterase domain-containing protein n=1 Tax=Heliorestis acidaminivorans TaxID=553427 RepID=UPI0014793647|nr:CheB methylesterase domain-containing protein [Heliorestis acidaminivorans]